jgi:hypothetical protein
MRIELKDILIQDRIPDLNDVSAELRMDAFGVFDCIAAWRQNAVDQLVGISRPICFKDDL